MPMSSKAAFLAAVFCLTVLLPAVPACATGSSAEALSYPVARKADNSDVYSGVTVKDPYRWLEDADSPETKQWVEQEETLTRDYLDKIPQRPEIAKRLRELWNYGRCDLPRQEGKRLFFTMNTGLQNQAVLYVEDESNKRRVLIDPNTLTKDGTVNLANYKASRDGKLLVYGLSASGSDWEDWYFQDVTTGKKLPDHLKWLKNAEADWSPDSKGVYYSRFDEPKTAEMFREANYYHKVYYHELGTDQSKDKLIYERKDQKEWDFSPMVSDDNHYLIITASHGTSPKNGVFVKDLSDPSNQVLEMFPPGRAMFSYIGNDGSTFWFLSDENAPTAKIVAVSANFEKERIHIAQTDLIAPVKDTLEDAAFVNGKFLCHYLKDAASSVSLYNKDGKFDRLLELPGVGTVHGFAGHQDDSDAYFSYTSFNAPPTVYKLNPQSNSQSVFFQADLQFNPGEYITEQIFCKSSDGTNVPVFVSHKKGLPLDGRNPTFLYAYGGFKISMTPTFSPSNLLWMERGGVYALAVLRGGGEYGEQWHEAGMKLHKQRVFDDFAGAARGLIEKKYTSTPKLSIGGGSNGGLLVGASITQHPELFGAAIAQVGVMDMLRFNQFTVGWEWEQEYGSPKDAEQFKALHAYSPLHNIKSGVCYPATMITTADHDDRVVPGHSFKFAATLQAAQGCANPTLIRIDTKAGHGHGKSTDKLIDEAADKWAFLTKTLNVEQHDVAHN